MLIELAELARGGSPVQTKMFVGGRWVSGSAGALQSVENPADGSQISLTPQASAADAEEAVAAARKAQPHWAALAPVERGRLVGQLADQVIENAELLAQIITMEQGKPIGQARGEVGATATFLRYASEQARRIEGEIVPSDARNEEIWVRRVPHGVVTGITAWNYPAALAARKLGPALVAGNAFVLKSHEFTPLSGLFIAALAEKVGFPAGVINVVTGDGRVAGSRLVELSDMVTMTGSTRAGREIYRAGADDIKVVRLELGGKAPFIVMEDADIDAAVESAVTARFTNCGQICTCNERMYLHRAISDEFLEKFVARVRALTIAPPLEDPDLGPKISAGEVTKVEEIIARSVAEGAEELLRGGAITEGRLKSGYFMAPSVLLATSNGNPAMQEEIFGPVAIAMVVDDFEQALANANDTDFGLSAFVYTKDLRRLMRLTNELNFGEIYFNRTNGELVQGFHSGWGLSGIGGEDGKHGFEGYLRKKTMYVNWS
ncbi:MAG: aldehyde dehydrogenase family protein [Pseudorhizobium sp.]